MKHTIFLALGTNVGEKKENIKKAIHLLEKYVTDIISAPIYKTKPVGYLNQDNFFNTVLKGETTLKPEALLQVVKTIEKEVGRIKRFQNGPREIDIDILFFDNLIFQSDRLSLPHPRLQDRDFVLQPLCDIAEHFQHPSLKKTVKQLLKELLPENRAIIAKLEM